MVFGLSSVRGVTRYLLVLLTPVAADSKDLPAGIEDNQLPSGNLE